MAGEKLEFRPGWGLLLSELTAGSTVSDALCLQVTTNMSGGSASHGFQQQQQNQQQQPGASGSTSSGYLQAALGTKWAHCVNVRLVLERAAADRRLIKIVKSPCSANMAVEFRITGKGVEEVEGGGAQFHGQDVLGQRIADEQNYLVPPTE